MMPPRDTDFPYHFDTRGRTATTEQEDYVRDLIEQVLFVSPGERVMRDDFGSGLLALTFEPNSTTLAATAQMVVQSALQHYLADLPDDYRIAILLHDAQGVANAELAELVGCSLATAKIRVHRARRRLREALAAACSFEIDDRGVLVCEPQPGTEMTWMSSPPTRRSET